MITTSGTDIKFIFPVICSSYAPNHKLRSSGVIRILSLGSSVNNFIIFLITVAAFSFFSSSPVPRASSDSIRSLMGDGRTRTITRQFGVAAGEKSRDGSETHKLPNLSITKDLGKISRTLKTTVLPFSFLSFIYLRFLLLISYI